MVFRDVKIWLLDVWIIKEMRNASKILIPSNKIIGFHTSDRVKIKGVKIVKRRLYYN